MLAIVRDRPLGPVARISTDRTVDCCSAPTAPRSPSSATTRWSRRPARASGSSGASGSWNWPRAAPASPRPAGPAGQPAASMPGARPRGTGPNSPGCWRAPHGRRHTQEAEGRSDSPRGRRTGRNSWSSGIARCGRMSYDSVHQMRVTTRKIRSLLQASEGAFGISSDAWVLDELRQLAEVLGVARDAEVLAERYERALNELAGRLDPRPDPQAVGGWCQAALSVRAAAVVDRDAIGTLFPSARRTRRVGCRSTDADRRRRGRGERHPRLGLQAST